MFKGFEYLENADLKNWSTIKIGGIASYIVFPKNQSELAQILKICQKNKQKYYILGNGSNVLFDAGFNGVLINLKYFNEIEFDDVRKDKSDNGCSCYENKDDKSLIYNEECLVKIGAGVKLFALNQKLKKIGLSGLEWSYGIPATLGGLVAMNGGCFGHEISEFIEKVLVFDGQKAIVLKKDDMSFDYRFCSLKDRYIILAIWLRLQKDESDKIEKRMLNFFERKKLSQPCDYPSLGSVFKQIRNADEIVYPAKLIDNMGLKGVKIGKAQISQKHAGFIINLGGATSADFLALVGLIQEKLREVGVEANPEIIILR